MLVADSVNGFALTTLVLGRLRLGLLLCAVKATGVMVFWDNQVKIVGLRRAYLQIKVDESL